MRGISFRGKRVSNGEWVEGFYNRFPCKRCLGGEHHIQTVEDDGGIGTVYTVHEHTVGQFTGLTDKAGRKVFEHDIIEHRFGDEIGVIRYGEYTNSFGDDGHGGHVGFYVDWVAGASRESLRKDLVYWAQNGETVGNIHDNPELIKNAAVG